MRSSKDSFENPSEHQYRLLQRNVLSTLEREGLVRHRGVSWMSLATAAATAAFVGLLIGHQAASPRSGLGDLLLQRLEQQASGEAHRSPAILASGVEVRPVGDAVQLVFDVGVRVELVEDTGAAIVQEVLRQALAISDSPTVRRTAVALLAGREQSRAILEAAARTDHDEIVRFEALSALLASPVDHSQLLEERLTLDPSLRVRWLAFETLYGAEAAADPVQRTKLRIETEQSL